MSIRRRRTYNGMSAARIIARQTGYTSGGDNLTGEIRWQYRTGYTTDGYRDDFALRVCDPEEATCLTILDGAGLPIAVMDI